MASEPCHKKIINLSFFCNFSYAILPELHPSVALLAAIEMKGVQLLPYKEDLTEHDDWE